MKNREILKYMEDGLFPKKAGVYLLQNTKNKKVYIGSTSNIRARIASHRSLLANRKHHSWELQYAFNEDILAAKVLVVLPDANRLLLREAEKILIKASPQLFPRGIMNKKLINFAEYKKKSEKR